MNRIFIKYCLVLLALITFMPQAQACTRALYVGSESLVITGRTMDWSEDMGTDLWLLPRGISRSGEAGPDSLQWTSKYGSVVASVYGIASADGMNEKGLVMNMLYLAVAEVLSVMRAVSVPLGIAPTPGQPNIASTLWRAIADQKNRIYYFDSSTLPNTFWISFDSLNFSQGAPVQKLELANGHVYSGETAKEFKVAKSFQFMPAAQNDEPQVKQ